MPKHIRHIWAKANQYIKIHRKKPKRQAVMPPSIHMSGDEIKMTAIIVVAVVLLVHFIGC